MYLLLGHRDDPCCAGVLARLEGRGLLARIVSGPLDPPARLTWRLDDAGLVSRLSWLGVPPDAEIAGVLVRGVGWLDPAGWAPADHAYMQAEVQAATLAWLAGLRCPVINRADAALWYRARPPLLGWRSLLLRSGLAVADVVVSNDPDEARAFGVRLAASGLPGAIYTPLTGEAGYPVAGEDDWRGLAALQAEMPVCLTEPHGPATSACVVGGRTFWDGDPGNEARALDPALQRFVAAAGLAFVEITVAPIRLGLGVVGVNPLPDLAHFGADAREHILDAIVDLLASETASVPAVLP